jgi:hypothetical protein
VLLTVKDSLLRRDKQKKCAVQIERRTIFLLLREG